ncbi:DBF4-type zinc finger-containing protein 2 homolog [Haemorhous mexicanus]|uniref:DBF4-type zinc finger-containing protein 2 homolog n=1 Tax=Haemorhous mexicanus TaxID=30427 RepID=UPI0028BEFD34|nr:DBF4-type zinc finger-containing protein 2 homolog [Haemorhous mexicanus]XP_059727012.1 DBF4-type zinc finger-containing protein 2 homolog [Haemorhous mexicanus]
MHCPGERCPPLLLPGPKFIPELLPPCQAHPEPFANTCHPLSITKGPAPRWQSCPQAATAASLLPCRPLVQKCLLLYPEPCETTRLLPRPRGSGVPQSPPAPRGDKRRAARSLPPCAPRCPEPGRLRFPPCGIRGSSASCRALARPHKAAACPPRCPELSGGYSLPLRGVTECPPQQSVTRSFLREQLAGVAPHRCSKGYPTQEFGTCCSSEQRLSVTKVTEERPPMPAVAKGSPQLEGTKGRSCSAQHLSKSRCGHHQHPRGSPRPSRLAPAGAKRSGRSKKSRGASKWLW